MYLVYIIWLFDIQIVAFINWIVLRVHDDCNEEWEYDVGEEHDEAVQVNPGKSVNHWRILRYHAKCREHVVTYEN